MTAAPATPAATARQAAASTRRRPGGAPWWLAAKADAPAPTPSRPVPAPMHFSITAPQPEYLILNLRNYPAWQVFLNGSLDPTRDRRADGLIAFPIPAGASTIDIRYTRTRDQTLGDALTVLALLVLLALLLMRHSQSARTGNSTP